VGIFWCPGVAGLLCLLHRDGGLTIGQFLLQMVSYYSSMVASRVIPATS
jgi:hypothetical protein